MQKAFDLKFVTVFSVAFFLFLIGTGPEINAQTCVSMSSFSAYTENFDTLANTPNGSTSSTLPTGFDFVETGTDADGLYTVSNGGFSSGNTYSYGSTDSTERALGSQTSGSLTPVLLGACFSNDTGSSISVITLQYTGEQWRSGTASSDALTFEYSTDATGLTSGTYTAVPALDFNSLVNTGGGSLDGNDAANRLTISAQFAVSLAAGGVLWIRWTDTDVLGSDHGLSVDDLSLTPAVPTAARVDIGGKIMTTMGRGVARVTVMLTGGELPAPVFTRSNSFGKYRFNDIPIGRTYVLTVFPGKYEIEQTSLVLNVNETRSSLNFFVNAY